MEDMSQLKLRYKEAFSINFHEICLFLNPKISARISVQRLDFWNGSVWVTSKQDICFSFSATKSYRHFLSWP